jgi:uncharacterized Zn-finger protein
MIDERMERMGSECRSTSDESSVGLQAKRKRYTCDVCEKDFKSVKGLKCHMALSMHAEPYACTVCEKKFDQLEQLQSHMRSVHIHKCSVCKKTFNQSDHLEKHIMARHMDV